MDHKYFTADDCTTDIVAAGEKRRRGEGSLAIFAGDAPRRNAQGRITSMSFRAPLLLVTDNFGSQGPIAADLVRILNAHAGEFFPSATTREQRQIAHDRRVLAGEI